MQKYYIWNPAICSCENGKYLASIIDDSVITCNEIISAEDKSYDKETKANFVTTFNGKKQSVKHIISIFYLHFY